MKKNNYAELRNMAELDRALRDNRRRLEKKGRAIRRDFTQAQSVYTPSNLLRTGVQQAAIGLIGPELLLRSIRRAKKLLK